MVNDVEYNIKKRDRIIIQILSFAIIVVSVVVALNENYYKITLINIFISGIILYLISKILLYERLHNYYETWNSISETATGISLGMESFESMNIKLNIERRPPISIKKLNDEECLFLFNDYVGRTVGVSATRKFKNNEEIIINIYSPEIELLTPRDITKIERDRVNGRGIERNLKELREKLGFTNNKKGLSKILKNDDKLIDKITGDENEDE